MLMMMLLSPRGILQGEEWVGTDRQRGPTPVMRYYEHYI